MIFVIFDVCIQSFSHVSYFLPILFKMPSLKLKASDDKVFEVDLEIAKCSETIKTMLQSLGEDNIEDEVISLPHVHSEILKKIIQWATYHKDDPPQSETPMHGDLRTNDISAWDADFLDCDQDTLYELLLACNYLNIRGLMQITCKTVANLIKGKTAEEIRSTFGIQNDLSDSDDEEEGSMV